MALKQQCFCLSLRFGFVLRQPDLSRIDAPDVPIAVVGNPNRPEAEANGVRAFVVAILFQYAIRPWINSDEWSSARCRPNVTTTKRDVATASRDLGLYSGDDAVLLRIDASDTAIRLAEHPNGIIADGGETWRCGNAYLRSYCVRLRINTIDLAFAGTGHPHRDERHIHNL